MRYVADKDGHWIPYEIQPSDVHYVQPDFEEHGGRAKFKDYLKRNDCVEMGHTDLKAATEKWNQRQLDNQREMAQIERKGVRPAEAPAGEITEYQRSRMNNEVRNRLEGRPAPDIKTLIRITLEEARRRH